MTLRFIASCLAIALVARSAGAQAERRLDLHVIDSVSGAPVARAEVRVLKTVKDTAGWMLRQTTDSTGRAVVVAPPHEQLLMMVRRLGFESSFFPVVASDSDDSRRRRNSPTRWTASIAATRLSSGAASE